jgi:hypothetical protein
MLHNKLLRVVQAYLLSFSVTTQVSSGGIDKAGTLRA